MLETQKGRNLKAVIRGQLSAGRLASDEANLVLSSFLAAAPNLRKVALNRSPRLWRQLLNRYAFPEAFNRWREFLGLWEANGGLGAPSRPAGQILMPPALPNLAAGFFDLDEKKPDCCVLEFAYPQTLRTSAWAIGDTHELARNRGKVRDPNLRLLEIGFFFTVDALFDQSETPTLCSCGCCRFHQFVDAVIVVDDKDVDSKYQFGQAEMWDRKPYGEDGTAKRSLGNRSSPMIANLEKSTPTERARATYDVYVKKEGDVRELIRKVESNFAFSRNYKSIPNRFNKRVPENPDLRRLLLKVEEVKTKEAALKSRPNGCYYWMFDNPKFSVFPGAHVFAGYYFEGVIATKEGVECTGKITGPSSGAFAVAIEVDWRKDRKGKSPELPTVKYAFTGLRVEPSMNFGNKVTSADVIWNSLAQKKSLHYKGADQGKRRLRETIKNWVDPHLDRVKKLKKQPK